MARPTKYSPLNAFQPLNSDIGVQLDRNFSEIAYTIGQLVDLLTVLTRDDSRLANATVTIQSLSADLVNFIQAQNDQWLLKGTWQGGRQYKYGDIIQNNNAAYGCSIQHISKINDFAYDLAQGYWQILTGDVGNTPSLAYVDTNIALAKTSVLNTVASIYITAASAAAQFITNASANTLFLTIANAANTYLTLTQAASIYATKAELGSYALINSPAFTGIPTAPTPTAGDFSTKIATTAFVAANFDAIGTMQVFTSSGTFIVPAGTKKCKVTVIGGGGSDFRNSGGTSSFGSYASATGGQQGDGGGGLGGVGFGGQVNIQGQNGYYNLQNASNPCMPNPQYAAIGGSTVYGFGATLSGLVAQSATGYGSGGIDLGNGSGGAGGCAIGVYGGLTDNQTITVTIGAGGATSGRSGIVIVEY